MQNRVTLGNIFGNALIVVCTGEPRAVVVDVLDVDDHLSRVGVGRTAKILSSDDQLVRILKRKTNYLVNFSFFTQLIQTKLNQKEVRKRIEIYEKNFDKNICQK